MSKQPSLNLRKQITKSRPNLGENSIHSYITSLRMLYSQHVDNDPEKLEDQLDTAFLHNFSEMKKLVEMSRTLNTQKNRLTAILVSLDSEPKKDRDQKLIDKYQGFLQTLMKKHNKELDSQKLTRSQGENWMTMDEVKGVINKIKKDIDEKELWKKDKLTKTHYNLLQKYVLIYFYINFHLRNNVADTRVVSPSEYKKADKDKNYLVVDGNKMTFKLNTYKNVKRLGAKSIDITPNVTRLLKKWLKKNKSGFMFTLSNGVESLSANGVTKILNSIFKEYAGGKKVSTSLLRHIAITDEMEGEDSIAEKKAKEKDIENRFQHGSAVHDQYRKLA